MTDKLCEVKMCCTGA